MMVLLSPSDNVRTLVITYKLNIACSSILTTYNMLVCSSNWRYFVLTRLWGSFEAVYTT